MSKYEVRVYKSVENYLDNNKLLRKAFDAWVPKLEANPHQHHDGKVVNQYFNKRQVYKKRLLGTKYRALFTINDNEILVDVFDIGSRGDIYK